MLKAKPQPEKRLPSSGADMSAPLTERIAAFRDELDQFIDSRAEALKAESPGVPLQVLKSILTRNGTCQCQAVLHVLEES